MQRTTCHRVGPTLLAADVAGMFEQIRLRVVRMAGGHQELIDHVLISIHFIVAIGIFGIEGSTHVHAIEPHLVRIDLLVPETSIGIARLSIELASKQVQCFLVLHIFGLFIDAEKDFPRIHTIKAILFQLIFLDGTVVVDHRIGVCQGIVIKLLVAIAIVHVEHGLKLQPMTIIPLQLRLEIELPRLRPAYHFRLGHTDRPRLVNLYILCFCKN